MNRDPMSTGADKREGWEDRCCRPPLHHANTIDLEESVRGNHIV